MGFPGTILLPLAARMAPKWTPKVIPEPLQNALKVKLRYFGVLGCLQEGHFSLGYKDIRLFVYSTGSGGGQKGRLGRCGQATGG